MRDFTRNERESFRKKGTFFMLAETKREKKRKKKKKTGAEGAEGVKERRWGPCCVPRTP